MASDEAGPPLPVHEGSRTYFEAFTDYCCSKDPFPPQSSLTTTEMVLIQRELADRGDEMERS